MSSVVIGEGEPGHPRGQGIDPAQASRRQTKQAMIGPVGPRKLLLASGQGWAQVPPLSYAGAHQVFPVKGLGAGTIHWFAVYVRSIQ